MGKEYDKVEKVLKAKAIEHGFYVYLLEGKSGSEGVADMLLFSSDGESIYIETKYKTKVSNKQKMFLTRAKYAFVARWKDGEIRIRSYSGTVSYSVDDFWLYWRKEAKTW